LRGLPRGGTGSGPSYLATGNLIVGTALPATVVQKQVESAVPGFGLNNAVLGCDQTALGEVIAANPFTEERETSRVS